MVIDSDTPIETDDGPERPASERMCIVSRNRLPIAELIRFVVSPEGVVTPDLKRRLPGRGVWVEAKRPIVELAIKRKAFARSFKTELTTPFDLSDMVENLIEQGALQSLSMANKAGKVVAGQTKVESEIAKGTVLAVLHAQDAASDSIRKLGQCIKRRFIAQNETKQNITVLSVFQSTQMSLCLGREHVIHICLVRDAASRNCFEKCCSLLKYRDMPDRLVSTALGEEFGLEYSDPNNLPVEPIKAERIEASG